MNVFLTQIEISQIKQDFLDYLNSPSCPTVKLAWITGHTGTWDADYEKWSNDTPTYSELEVKAAFRSVTTKIARRYGWGEALLGNAIFLFASTVDLAKEGLKIEYVVSGQTTIWYPENPQPAAPEGLIVPLGNDSMSQILVCKKER